MKRFLSSPIGRLRILAFLEGLSLIILVFIGMPMKHEFDNPAIVKSIGPLHGGLFLLFVYYTFQVSMEQNWKFWKTTWKVLLASFIPFGTFYIDKKILSPLHQDG